MNRPGVYVSPEERQAIENMVAEGDMTGAQNAILDKLEKEAPMFEPADVAIKPKRVRKPRKGENA